MRGKSYAALTVHGLTKSFRKTHLVALDLIQAKVHTALAVLSFLLLPSVSYLYHAFNAEVQLFSEYSSSTLLQKIPAFSLQKFLRTARHCVRRNTTRKAAQKSTKGMEMAYNTAYVLLIQDTPSVHATLWQYYPSCFQSL
jgi:hypothetical protein